MQRNRIISGEDSSVVVAINSLGDRFSHDIAELGQRLDKVIDAANANAVANAGLQAKVAGIQRILYTCIGAGLTINCAIVASLLTGLL